MEYEGAKLSKANQRCTEAWCIPCHSEDRRSGPLDLNTFFFKNTFNSIERVSQGEDVCVCCFNVVCCVMRSICLSNFVILARAALRSPVCGCTMQAQWSSPPSTSINIHKPQSTIAGLISMIFRKRQLPPSVWDNVFQCVPTLSVWGNDTSDFADVEAVKAATNLKLQLEATAKKATGCNPAIRAIRSWIQLLNKNCFGQVCQNIQF